MARPTEVEKLLERLLKEQKNSNEVLEQLTEDSESRESRESRRPVKSVKPTLFVTGKRASQSDYIAARGAMATEKYTKAYLADLKGQKKKNKKAGVDNKKAEEKKDKAEAKRFKKQIDMQEDMIDAINGGFDSMNDEEKSRYDRESQRAAQAAKKKLRQEKEERAKAKEERGFFDKWIGDTKDAFTDKVDEVVTNIDKTTKIKLRQTKSEKKEEKDELRKRSEDMLDKMANTAESQMTRSEKTFAKLIKENDYNFDGISNDMIDIIEKLGDKLQENDDRFEAKWGEEREELAKKLSTDFATILETNDVDNIKEFIKENKKLNDSIAKSIQRDYDAEQELNNSFEVFGKGSEAQEKLLKLIKEDSSKQSQIMRDYLDYIKEAHDVEIVEEKETRKQLADNTKMLAGASRESADDIIDVLVDGDESDQDRHLALTDATKTSSAVVVKKMDDTEKKEDERHQETMEAEAEIIDDRKAEFRDNFLKRKHELKIKEESLNTLQLILKKLGVCCVGNGLGKGNSLKNQTKPSSGGWLSGVLGMGAGLLLMKKLLPKLMGMKVVKTILSKFGLGKVVGSMVDAFTKLSAKTLLMSTMFGGAIKVFSDIFKGTKTVAEATKASTEALKVAKAAKDAKVVTKAAEALKVAKVVPKAVSELKVAKVVPKAVAVVPKVANNVIQKAPVVANGANHAFDFITKGPKPSMLKGLGQAPLINNPKYAPKSMPKLSPKIAKGWLGKQKQKYAMALDDLTTKMMKNIKLPKYIPRKVAEKMVRKEASKILVKKIPVFGLLMSAGFAASDLSEGKMGMAGLQIASGVSSVFAGPGTAASLGFDAAYIYKMFDDYKEESENNPSVMDNFDASKGKVVLTSSPAISANNPTVHKKKSSNGLASAYEFNKKSFETPGVVVVNKDSEILEEVRDQLVSLNDKEKDKAQKLKEADAKAKADKSVTAPKEKIKKEEKEREEKNKSTIEKVGDYSKKAILAGLDTAKGAYKKTMAALGVAVGDFKDDWNGTGNGSAGGDKYGNYNVSTGKYKNASGGSVGAGLAQGSSLSPESNKTGLSDSNTTNLKAALGMRESSNNYQAVNQLGYVGKYQMGAMALADIGLVKKGVKNNQLDNPSNWLIQGGKKGFLQNAELQETAMDKLLNINAGYLGNAKGDTQGKIAGMLAASHLLGAGGAKKGPGGSDANGTTWTEYYNLGANATGGSPEQAQQTPSHTSGSGGSPEQAQQTPSHTSGSGGSPKSTTSGTVSQGGNASESFLPAPKGGPLASAVPTMSSASGAMGPRNTMAPTTTSIGAVGPAGAESGGNNAANFAKQFKGKFQYSMNKRGMSSGGVDYLDCSLFVQKVIRGTGIDKEFPSTTATQVPYLTKKAQSQDKSVVPVGSVGELKAGDLVYFMNSAHHVVMMASDNSIIHSSSTHNNVVEGPKTYLTEGWGAKHLSHMFRYTNEGSAVNMKGKSIGEMSGMIKSTGGGNGAGTYGGSSGGAPSGGGVSSSGGGVSSSGGGAGAGFAEGGSTGNSSNIAGKNGANGTSILSDISKKLGGGEFGPIVAKVLGGNSELNKIIGSAASALPSGLTNTLSSIFGNSSTDGKSSIGGQLSQTLGNMDSLPFNGLMNQINSSKGGFNSSMLSSNNALAQGMSGLGNSLGNMTGTGAGATIPYVSSVSDSSLDILRGMLGGS